MPGAAIAIFADRRDRRIKSSIFGMLKPATHLAILYAHRGEFDRQRKSRAIFAGDDADTPGDFFR